MVDEGPRPGDDEVEGRDGVPVGRRAVLGLFGLGAAGVALGASIQDRVAATLAPISALDPTGLTQYVPGAGRFRIYTVTGDLPSKSRAAWRLEVGGLVRESLRLTFTDLTEMAPKFVKPMFVQSIPNSVLPLHQGGGKIAERIDIFPRQARHRFIDMFIDGGEFFGNAVPVERECLGASNNLGFAEGTFSRLSSRISSVQRKRLLCAAIDLIFVPNEHGRRRNRPRASCIGQDRRQIEGFWHMS